MAFGDVVQSATDFAVLSPELIVTLPAPPTSGNLLFAYYVQRSDTSAVWDTLPDGFEALGVPADATGSNSGTMALAYKMADGSEGTSFTFSLDATDRCRMCLVEIEGAGELDLFDLSSDQGSGTGVTSDSITPTQTPVVLLSGAVHATGGATLLTTPATWDLLDTGRTDGNFGPLSILITKVVDPASGPYDVAYTSAHGGQWGSFIAAFYESPTPPEPPADPEPGVWMDFDGDGFDAEVTSDPDAPLARMMPQANVSNVSDNVTAYTLNVQYNRGGSYDHVGAAGPGGATIVLRNSTGLFDPDNPASPVAGHRAIGMPVWVGVIKETGALSGTGTVRGVFGGYVREWVPTVDSSGQRVVEVICEDALGVYSRVPVSVAPRTATSHADLRTLILLGAGESSSRISLDTESGMMNFTAVDSQNALAVLEELNTATATRHFIEPADNKEDWYAYRTVNKLHKLSSAADQSLDGDDVHGVSGWRVTNDNLIEVQRADVTEISLTAANVPVWTYDAVPLVVTTLEPKVIWATFDDYVFDAALDTNLASGSIVTDITNFGKTSKIEIWASGTTAVLSTLRVLGRLVQRADTIQVVAGDDSPGKRAGQTISSDYVGSEGQGQGLVDFLFWKFGQPLKRPSLAVEGKSATTLATIFDRDLFDVMSLTVDKLSVTTARRIEIIGLSGTIDPARHHAISYEAQETPNQAAIDWFDLDTDTINGPAFLAPF